MRIFTWGSNFGGQLCLGHRSNEEVIMPKEVKPFADGMPDSALILVTGGQFQTYFVFEDGRVFGCGLNNCGQLGNLPFYVPLARHLTNLSKYKVVDLSARNETAYAITDRGICIGWGSNSSGQLGVPPYDMICTKKPVILCKNAVSVSAGGSHVAIIKENGSLLTCGNHKFGEIGRPYSARYKPTRVEIPTVITAGCGEFHTLALTKDGDLYGFGLNTFGQAGINPAIEECVLTPTKVELEYEVNTGSNVYLKCGREHSALHEENGNILLWGRNQYGQIFGVPHEPEFDWKPLITKGFDHVQLAAIGGFHNVICKKGKVHFWGWTEGRCSTKLDHKHRSAFLLKAILQDLYSLSFTMVGAGEKHSIVVAQ